MGESVLFNCSQERRDYMMGKLADVATSLKIIIYYDGSYGFDTAFIGKEGGGMFAISMGDMYHETHDLRAAITLMHEIGHFYDHASQPGVTWREYAHSHPWEREVGAWREGVHIGESIGLTDAEWDAYYEFMRRCLSTYQQSEEERATDEIANLKTMQRKNKGDE